MIERIMWEEWIVWIMWVGGPISEYKGQEQCFTHLD